MNTTAIELAKHGIRKSGNFYYQEGKRISSAQVQELVATAPTAVEPTAEPANWNFEKLNATTQAFFYSLCEQMMEATKDASMVVGVKIGKDIPSIGLANAPRLTNLKKAGVFAHGGRGWLQLTERGRAIFLATV